MKQASVSRGPPYFYLLTTHSLLAGLLGVLNLSNPTSFSQILYTKGGSTSQGQIYILSSHRLHLYSHYCSVTVLTTYSPLLTFIIFYYSTNMCLILTCMHMSRSLALKCMALSIMMMMICRKEKLIFITEVVQAIFWIMTVLVFIMQMILFLWQLLVVSGSQKD